MLLDLNESCHTWDVNTNSYVTHVSEPLHTCKWSQSQVQCCASCRGESWFVMNESHRIQGILSHVDDVSLFCNEWVTSRINESRHVWMSHVTYEWVMSHMNKSCHIWTSHVQYDKPRQWDMCMSNVTYEWVMSQMTLSACPWGWHVFNITCHIWTIHVRYEWVMVTYDKRRQWDMCMSHVTWISHVVCYSFGVSLRRACIEYHMAHINESWYTWMRAVLSEIQTQKINVTCYQRTKKVWHFVTFPNVHNVTQFEFFDTFAFWSDVLYFSEFSRKM